MYERMITYLPSPSPLMPSLPQTACQQQVFVLHLNSTRMAQSCATERGRVPRHSRAYRKMAALNECFCCIFYTALERRGVPTTALANRPPQKALDPPD